MKRVLLAAALCALATVAQAQSIMQWQLTTTTPPAMQARDRTGQWATIGTLPGSGVYKPNLASADFPFFPGATANVQLTGLPGADFTLAPCWATNNCGMMFYTGPTTDAQNLIPIFRLQRTAFYSGGVPNSTAPVLWVLDTTSLYGANAQWSILSEQHNNTRTSVSPAGGQNVAVVGAHFKDLDSSTVTITNSSPAVVTWQSSNFKNGDQIYLKTNGNLPSPLATGTNYYVISAGLTANAFRISATFNGPAINTTTSGTGVHTGVAEKSTGWGADFFTQDNTGIVNPTSSSIGGEVGSYTTVGAGTDSNNQRVALSVVSGVFPGTDAGVHIGTGILFNTIGGAKIDSAIRFAQINTTPAYGTLIDAHTATATTGIDFSLGTITNAIILNAGQTIGFEAANTHKLYFDSGAARLSYDVGGVYAFQVFDTGVARIGARASDPTGFSGGIYYNSTTNEFRSYGTVWSRMLVSKQLLASNTAPTIVSGFGTSASVTADNGTWAFRINVGQSGTGNSGVIGLPGSSNGWNCSATDITTKSSTVFLTKQTASSTATATIGNFDANGAAAAWQDNDILAVSCVAL